MQLTNEVSVPESASPVRVVAVIDIGASSVRMAIAEINGQRQFHVLDTLVQPVSLGRDTFTTRRIRRASIEQCVRVLRRYQRVLREYGITSPQQMRVVATSAVREAINRLAFLDRIYIATGIEVEPIDEAEVNRITYLGIQPQLDREPQLMSAKAVVVEVGGGSTELLVIRGGNVLFSNTYRLGALRLAQMLQSLGAPVGKRRAIMETQIRRAAARIREQVRVDTHVELIAIGGDMRFAATHLLGEWAADTLIRVPVDELERLTVEVLRRDEDAIVRDFGVSFVEAETLGPALLTHVLLAKGFELPHVCVSDTNLRDGVLHDMAVRETWAPEFRNQVIRSAISLGRKFDFDESHARHVANLARMLFQELAEEHALDSHCEIILYVAALLHEIGLYVNVRSNHKHAMYLIRNSELFGLGRRDVLLVSLVARYHRRAHPQPTHEVYAALDRDGRVVVAKLAAILRLAIALDDSRSGRVKEIRCMRQRERLVIRTPGVDDVSLEQLAMRQSGGLFEEVFGVPVLIRPGR